MTRQYGLPTIKTPPKRNMRWEMGFVAKQLIIRTLRWILPLLFTFWVSAAHLCEIRRVNQRTKKHGNGPTPYS